MIVNVTFKKLLSKLSSDRRSRVHRLIGSIENNRNKSVVEQLREELATLEAKLVEALEAKAA
jgi:hypothetical protein